MAVIAITTTPQDITGDFDIVVRGTAANNFAVALQKALGAGGANFDTVKVCTQRGHDFVKNTGTNAYKLGAAVAGVTVEFNQ